MLIRELLSLTEAPMPYRLVRLAPGSYDLEARLRRYRERGRDGNHRHHAVRWFAELLDEAGPRHALFVESVHEFGSFDEAAAWLGYPDTVNVARAGDYGSSRAAAPS